MGGFGGWITASLIGTVIAVAGFALAAFVISWAGKQLFQAEVSFEEIVRSVGLAYVQNALGVAGALALVMPLLICIVAPALIVAGLLGLASAFIAVREALDLSTGQTIITVIIGAAVVFFVNLVGTGILSGLVAVL